MTKLVKELLKAIPDDLTVGEAEEDDRVSFILDEYESFLEEGENLPKLFDEMLFSEVKKNLSLLPLSQQLELVAKYKYKFSKNSKMETLKTREMYIKYLFIYALVLFTFIISIVITLGVINNNFDVNLITQQMIESISKMMENFLLPGSNGF